MAFFQAQLKALNWSFSWLNVSEVLIIFAMVFAFYKRFIKNTQAEKLVKGIVFLFMVWVFSEVFNRF